MKLNCAAAAAAAAAPTPAAEICSSKRGDRKGEIAIGHVRVFVYYTYYLRGALNHKQNWVSRILYNISIIIKKKKEKKKKNIQRTKNEKHIENMPKCGTMQQFSLFLRDSAWCKIIYIGINRYGYIFFSIKLTWGLAWVALSPFMINLNLKSQFSL